MYRQRIFIIFFSALGMVAAYLPWVEVPFVGNVHGIESWGETFALDGRVAFVLFAISLLAGFLGPLQNKLEGYRLYIAFIPAAIAAAVGTIHILRFSYFIKQDFKDSFVTILQAGSSIQIGLYLVTIAGLLTVLASWLLGRPTARLK